MLIPRPGYICGDPQTLTVYFDGKPLSPAPSQRVHNHSPDGFNWGYSGSGPSQLALAILLELCTDKLDPARLYQTFKAEVIAGLPQDKGWELAISGVTEWLLKRGATVRPRYLSLKARYPEWF